MWGGREPAAATGSSEGQVPGGSPWTRRQRQNGLDPGCFSGTGLCGLLFKESSSPHAALQAQAESCCPGGHKGKRVRQGHGHPRSRTTKEDTKHRGQDGRGRFGITRGWEPLCPLIDGADIDLVSLAGSFRVPSLKALTHSTWWALLCLPF